MFDGIFDIKNDKVLKHYEDNYLLLNSNHDRVKFIISILKSAVSTRIVKHKSSTQPQVTMAYILSSYPEILMFFPELESKGVQSVSEQDLDEIYKFTHQVKYVFFNNLEKFFDGKVDKESSMALEGLCLVFSSLLPEKDYREYLKYENVQNLPDKFVNIIQKLSDVQSSYWSDVDPVQIKNILELFTRTDSVKISRIQFLLLILWLVRFLRTPLGQAILTLILRIIIVIVYVLKYLDNSLPKSN